VELVAVSWDCPVCEATLDAHVPDDGDTSRPPEPGDLMLCLYCGTVLVRRASAFAVAAEPDLARVPLEAREQLERMAATLRAKRH
jgi:hypothetical protein